MLQAGAGYRGTVGGAGGLSGGCSHYDSHTPGWPTPSLEASLHPRVTDSSRGSGPWPDCSLGAPSSADLPVLTHPRLSPCSSSPRPHLETLWDEYPHPGEPASVQSTLLPAPPCLPHCRSVCSDPAGLDDWEQAQKSCQPKVAARGGLPRGLRVGLLQHLLASKGLPCGRHHATCQSWGSWHSSSVVPFSSCPQYLPASGSFPMSQLLHFHALEKEMATHSSVLAWRIPGTGEPGELTSMGSHRVGHD